MDYDAQTGYITAQRGDEQRVFTDRAIAKYWEQTGIALPTREEAVEAMHQPPDTRETRRAQGIFEATYQDTAATFASHAQAREYRHDGTVCATREEAIERYAARIFQQTLDSEAATVV